MKAKNIWLIVLYLHLPFAILHFTCFAQDTSQYYNSDFIRYDNFVYKKNIRTVQLQKDDWEFTAPVIKLGSTDKLRLSFDDLDAESKNYHFTIIHCDASWNPSDRLLQTEYISGFFDDNINDYQYSRNTIQKYVHYELLFPTENLKPSKSGNYLLKVFKDYDQNDLIITRRFMVLDERVNIIPDIHHATIVNDYNYKQEIDFSIQTPGYQIASPYQDLKVVLMQNDRWDNAITKLKPLFVKDNELTYDYDNDNVFPGGNEFRNFDIKSLRWNSEYVKYIASDSLNYHVYLFPGKRRNFFQYLSDKDIDGKYKITRQESSPSASETEAEYVYVHFTLPMDKPVEEGSIYVFGGLTDWKYSNEYKMHYNKILSQYEATLYVKQGYYNYEYVYLKDNEKSGDEAFIEGTHYETENDYVIYVYHKPISSNYDQLIGMKRFNSWRY
ncbi:MAG: DUF5103 domain-containing protein [Bacteroidetes bacterium]|nr:DUF5103 domain-containing protein [Bacteroidota bacterium]